MLRVSKFSAEKNDLLFLTKTLLVVICTLIAEKYPGYACVLSSETGRHNPLFSVITKMYKLKYDH